MSSENFFERLVSCAEKQLTERGYPKFSVVQNGSGCTIRISRPVDKPHLIFFVPPRDSSNVLKIKNEQVTQLFASLEANECKHAIVAYEQIAPGAADIFATQDAYSITLTEYKYLYFDPTKHVLVPKHELVDPKSDHGVDIKNAPRILSTDPIVKYYGWVPGDLIKITRPNSEIYFRVVVDARKYGLK